jgi:hypothetical protein
MATPQNRQNTKAGENQGTAKKNYDAIRYGNKDGEIRMGQIAKQGDVISDVLLQGSEGTHVFALDKDGPRKGWTTSISPGNFQLDCGRDNKKEQDTCMIYAENGNIVINAGNGNLRFIANNVEFTVQGDDGSEGNFIVNASQNITLDAKQIHATAKNFLKLSSPARMEICANENLKMYGGLIQGVSDAVSIKDSKLGGQKFWNKQQK